MKNPAKINKQLQQFLKNNPWGVATFDATYHLLQVNPSFCEITAYTERDLNGFNIIDIIYPDDVDKTIKLLQQLLKGEIASFAVEQRWTKKSGVTVWVNLMISAISDDFDTFAYGIAMVEDITRYKQAEGAYQRLRERRGQTEQLATIGRLTSTLTHEINNSMHVVQGLLNLSLEELDNPVDLVSYLNMSLAESAKIVELIGRLRYSYRVDPEPATVVELNPLLEEVATLAHRELKRKNISVHTRLAANLPAINSRFSQLYLIFLSIALNLGEILNSMNRGEIEIRSNFLPLGVKVTLFGQCNEIGPDTTELDLSLSFSRDKIVELGGNLSIDKQNGGIACVVEIPFSIPETPPPV